MSYQEEQYYKIEAYLSGELDAGETAAFEQQISADDLLKAEVEKHKVANALIVEQRLLSVKNILKEERSKDSGPGNSFNPISFIIGAAIAVSIGTSVWMLNDIVRSSPDKSDASQINSGSVKSENSISEEAKMNALIKVSKQHAPVDDIGFHKQQIQQLEEHLHTDEKGILHIDSSFVQTRADIQPHMNVVNVPEEPVVSVKTVNPCANVSIQASIKPGPSCNYEPTGNILVLNINGGTKPYSVYIASNNNEAAMNGALPKGVYEAIVSDANGCVQKYSNIVVGEKDCPIDYSFNPFYGNEEWEIAPQEVDRELEIYDKGGALYFKKHIPASAPYKWNGMGTGNQVLPGYYIFVMKYANGTVQRGSVTIVQ